MAQAPISTEISTTIPPSSEVTLEPEEVVVEVPAAVESDPLQRMVETAFNGIVIVLSVYGILFGALKATSPLLNTLAAGYVFSRMTASKADDTLYDTVLKKVESLGVKTDDVMKIVKQWKDNTTNADPPSPDAG